MVPIPQLTVLIVQGPDIKLFQKFYGCVTSLNRSRHGLIFGHTLYISVASF